MRSLYGSYRQVKFCDIWPTYESFYNSSLEIKIPTNFQKDSSLEILYYLLYSEYGNSTVASSDTNRFKYAMFRVIFMYGPSWEKRLEIQSRLRELTEDEILRGSKAIYNHSYNPSTDPSTATMEELTTINEQNTTNYKRSVIEGYANLDDILRNDVTGEFLRQFRKLFLTVVEPERPLRYVTYLKEEEEYEI